MRAYRMVVWGAVLAGCFMPLVAAAQEDAFERTVRQCRENGFSRDACVAHAEKTLRASESYDRQYMDDRRRRLETQQERTRNRANRATRPERRR
ncbi:MAG: hypothetical protein RIA65_15295 [Woeseia sp.]